MRKIHIIKMKGVSILDQLMLEEALLRADNRNFCLINEGSNPAIVMGISGRPDLLIHDAHLKNNPVPVIKRFSGGGTVFVDHNTHFVTFICNSDEVNVPCFPKEVLNWTEKIYSEVFNGLDFQVIENDYVIGSKKFGGNAQYMQKKRWLHHSTLLWDFNPKNMEALKLPPKMPAYRKRRDHQDFLCTLKEYLPNMEELEEKLLLSLSKLFTIHGISQEELISILSLPHRKSTTMIKKSGC